MIKLCFIGGKISNNNILNLGIASYDYVQGSKLENVFIKNFNIHGNLSLEVENEFGITKENIENHDFIENYKYEIFFYLLQSDFIIGYDIANLKSELFKILPEPYYDRTINKLRFIDIKGMNNDTSLFELFKNCFKNEYSIPYDLKVSTLRKELNAIKQCFVYLDKKVGIVDKYHEETSNNTEEFVGNENRILNKIENSIYKTLLDKWGDNPEALNFIEHIIDGNKSIFLTGEAGTGKSTLIRDIIECNEDAGEEPIVLGSTGISAMNIRGKTVHSFFNLGVAPIYYRDMLKKIKSNKKGKLFSLNKNKLELIKRAPFIIIDEVSMLPSNVLDCINTEIAHYIGNELNFGGKQIIFIGDIYQLPPVANKSWYIKFGNKYQSEWFFDSDTFKGKMVDLISGKFDYRIINLKKNYRQGGDEKFSQMLARIRDGNITDEDISTINSKDSDIDQDYIYLSTHNDTVDRINNERLSKLKGKEFSFKAEILGNFPRDMRKNNEEIVLKRGARIMMINNDTDGGWVNGTLGEVIDFDQNDESIMVKLENGKIRNVQKYTWKYTDFTTKDGELKEVILGSYTQIPVQLAYAITVHKSQGLTFNKCQMNLPKTFKGGQGYTALSRVRSLDGLKLDGRINKDILYFDDRVIEFKEEMEKKIKQDMEKDFNIENNIEDTGKNDNIIDNNYVADINQSHIADKTIEINIKHKYEAVYGVSKDIDKFDTSLFIIKKGACWIIKTDTDFYNKYKNLLRYRNELICSKKIKVKHDCYIASEDIKFNNPLDAAIFIKGGGSGSIEDRIILDDKKQSNDNIEKSIKLMNTFKLKKGLINAEGVFIDDIPTKKSKFKVLKGSTCPKYCTESLKKYKENLYLLRKKLIQEGILELKDNDILYFKNDYLFKNLANASCILSGSFGNKFNRIDFEGNIPKFLYNEEDEKEIYYLIKSDIRAFGYFVDGKVSSKGKFTILKGSKGNIETTYSFDNYKENAYNLRQTLMKEGKINEKNNYIEFLQNYTFSNITEASCIILGTSTGSIKDWKDSAGKKLN